MHRAVTVPRENVMRSRRLMREAAVGSLLLLAAACGGGGSSVSVGPPVGDVVAQFVADAPSGAPRVSMESGGEDGEAFSVEIHASAIPNIYGAGFTVVYDPTLVEFTGCDATGSILLSGPAPGPIPCNGATVAGAQFDAALENGVAGTLNVVATRSGAVAGAAGGSGLLVTLAFIALDEIATPEPIGFDRGPSREVQVCPSATSCNPPLSGTAIPWDEGTVTAVPE